MLIAIDVGNTHVVLGLYRDEELVSSWRLQSKAKRTVDEYALDILGLLASQHVSSSDIHQLIISCVVPSLTRVFTKLGTKYFSADVLVVGPGIKTGVVIACDDPRSVGPDRIVNAMAAKEMFGEPVIVVDFGTATTFDVITKSGTYEGGVIAPGLLISAEALFERAALLPSIELKKPKCLIGKNTTDSMLSGIIYGYVGLVDGILERLVNEIKDDVKIIATGGLAQMIADESKYIKEVLPNLTLSGLSMIAKLNR
jgi:type III pantothenate kinase